MPVVLNFQSAQLQLAPVINDRGPIGDFFDQYLNLFILRRQLPR